MILLVPYAVLVNSQFQALRKDFNLHLKEIIVLPTGAIKYIGVKTTLLVFGANKSDSVSFSQLTEINKLTEDYLKTKKKKIPKTNLTERWDAEFHLLKDSSFYKELENFKTVKLSELAEIINGINITTNKLLNEGQLLYLKPVHLKGEKLIADKSLAYVNKDELTEKDYKCIVQPLPMINESERAPYF